MQFKKKKNNYTKFNFNYFLYKNELKSPQKMNLRKPKKISNSCPLDLAH